MIVNGINNLIRFFKTDRRLKVVLFASLIVCLSAHAFSYFNGTLTAFRQVWFPGFEPDYSQTVYSGGFLAPFYAVLNHNAYLPWLNGVLACVALCFSVYIICDVWDVKRDLSIWIIAGLIIADVNVTIAHFSYPAMYLTAFLFSLISVEIWNHTEMPYFARLAEGSVFVLLSLGTYSPYAAAGPIVICILCGIRLLEGRRISDVLKRSAEYLIMIVAGGVIYAVIYKFLLPDGRVERLTEAYDNQIIKPVNMSELRYSIVNGVRMTVSKLCGIYFDGYKTMPSWMAVLTLIIGVVLVILCAVSSKRMRSEVRRYPVFVIYILLALIFASFVYPLSLGTVNTVCALPFILIYAGFMKFAEFEIGLIQEKGKAAGIITSVLTVVLSVIMIFTGYKGILVSNMCYARLSNLYVVSDGIAKRIVERVENSDGFTGTEDIYIIGDIAGSHYLDYSRYEENKLLGLLEGIDYVDRSRANLCLSNEQLKTLIEENNRVPRNIISCYDNNSGYFDADEVKVIDECPEFPADGSVVKINGKMIVKLTQWWS